jgi:epidermal growth factor receptor substrate 15
MNFMVALKLVALAQNNMSIDLSNLDMATALPQFENMVTPSQAARPKSMAVNSSSPSISAPNSNKLNPPLTQSTVDKYLNIFVKTSQDGQILEGNSVKAIMMKSQLPVDQLKDIWSLSDFGNKGHLDTKEFVIAMYYIEGLMSQTLKDLPVVLSPQLTSTAQSLVNSSSVLNIKKSFNSPQRMGSIRQSSIPSMTSSPNPTSITPSYTSMDSIFMGPKQDSNWAVSQEEQSKFTSFFESAVQGQDRNYLTSDEAYDFFQRSKLSKAVLAHIW